MVCVGSLVVPLSLHVLVIFVLDIVGMVSL